MLIKISLVLMVLVVCVLGWLNLSAQCAIEKECTMASAEAFTRVANALP